ncbi:MAG: hypothetical protein QM765_38810 [Myxococcales bacterium]
MNMEKIEQLFRGLYEDFRTRRDGHIGDARFAPWFRRGRNSAYPPVIGFGLPRRDDEQIPMVTIGINPSTEEFPAHIARDENVAFQWLEQTGYFEWRDRRGPYRDWFDFSNDLVTEVRYPEEMWSHYEIASVPGGVVSDGTRRVQRVPHLDLTPVVTDGGMERVEKDVADKNAAPDLLGEGIEFCLLPLLEHLVKGHSTRLAVLYGYVPAEPGKSLLQRTLPGLFSRVGKGATIDGRGPVPTIKVAAGTFDMQDARTARRGSLSDLRVVFCSHGPSALNRRNDLPRAGDPATKYSDSMTKAGRKVREWCSEEWWRGH